MKQSDLVNKYIESGFPLKLSLLDYHYIDKFYITKDAPCLHLYLKNGYVIYLRKTMMGYTVVIEYNDTIVSDFFKIYFDTRYDHKCINTFGNETIEILRLVFKNGNPNES